MLGEELVDEDLEAFLYGQIYHTDLNSDNSQKEILASQLLPAAMMDCSRQHILDRIEYHTHRKPVKRYFENPNVLEEDYRHDIGHCSTYNSFSDKYTTNKQNSNTISNSKQSGSTSFIEISTSNDDEQRNIRQRDEVLDYQQNSNTISNNKSSSSTTIFIETSISNKDDEQRNVRQRDVVLDYQQNPNIISNNEPSSSTTFFVETSTSNKEYEQRNVRQRDVVLDYQQNSNTISNNKSRSTASFVEICTSNKGGGRQRNVRQRDVVLDYQQNPNAISNNKLLGSAASSFEISTCNKDDEQINVRERDVVLEFEKKLHYYRQNVYWSRKCQSDYWKLKKDKLTVEEFFSNLEKRLKAQKQQIESYIRKQKIHPHITPDVINVISSSEGSDVEIVDIDDDMKRCNIKDLKGVNIKYLKTSAGESDHDDDAVIYVAPPPVTIINLDESDSENTNLESGGKDPVKNVQKEPPDQEDTSNDFLGNDLNCSTENFNFSLHGSEFQNSDFAKPANPDSYETDSTSTSDLNKESNRNFSNTVKTIVFNEVDFPKNDVFTENNLDSFSDLITPKRTVTALEATVANNESEAATSSKNVLNVRTLSETSSESDYDTSNMQSQLPDLTPMIADNPSPKKKLKITVTDSPTKGSKKSSFKRTSEHLDSSETPKKKAKRKKKQLGTSDQCENVLESEGIQDNTEDLGAILTSTPKKVADKEVKKKKKKRSRSSSTVSGCDVSPVLNQSVNKKTKKKKKDHCENSASSSTEMDNQTILYQDPNDQNVKADCSEVPAENQSFLNDTEPMNQCEEETENPSIKRNKKKKHKKSDSNCTSNTVESPVKNDNTSIQEITACNTENLENDDHINKIAGTSAKDIDETSVNNNNGRNEQQSTESNENGSETICFTRNIPNNDIDITQSREVESEKNTKEKVNENWEEDLIIVDEVETTSMEVETFVIESSESEGDFRNFDDVGNNLLLANTNNSKNYYSIDKSIDYSEFNVDNILEKMSDDPKKWSILKDDIYLTPRLGPRCHKCKQKGHKSFQCRNKSPLPCCNLCGNSGHAQDQCPNTMCLGCSKPTNILTTYCWTCNARRNIQCHLCKLRGHLPELCPDLWRRYHLTVKEGPLVLPKEDHKMKTRDKYWCSACASQGHLEFECNFYKWVREYPRTSPYVYKYDDVYNTTSSTHDPSSSTTVVESSSNNLNSSNSSHVSRHNTRGKRQKINPVSLMTAQQSSSSTFQQYHSMLSAPLLNNASPDCVVVQPSSHVVTNQVDVVPVPDAIATPQFCIQNSGDLQLNRGVATSEPIENVCGSSNDPMLQGSRNKTKQSYHFYLTIPKKFLTDSRLMIRSFLSSELKKLEKIETDIRFYMNKLQLVNNLNQIVQKNRLVNAQIFTLYKKINMFLFGYRQICDGPKHLHLLLSYSCHSNISPLGKTERNQILEAYNYIFGGQHSNFNYLQHLKNLPRR